MKVWELVAKAMSEEDRPRRPECGAHADSDGLRLRA